MAEIKKIKCSTCGKAFIPKENRKNRKTKFCSRKCIRNSTQFSLGHKRTLIGNKRWDNPETKKVWFKKGEKPPFSYFGSPNWIPWNKGLDFGGQERFRNKIMGLTMYRTWRELIRQRDNQRCVLCGESDEKLHVDHYPKSFAKIISDNGIETVQQAKLCNEFWSLDNARTLCFPCHKKTETYGKRLR